MKSIKYSRKCFACGVNLYYSSLESKRQSDRNKANCSSCSALNLGKSRPMLNLLNRDFIFYYWLGFILADGHISNNRLVVTLSENDVGHMKKLADYIGVKYKKLNKTNRNHVNIAAQNKKVLGAICRDFNINANKTENPPNTEFYDNLTKDELLSLFVGFIDGDGSIGNLSKRVDFHLRIQCHSSWYKFISYINERLVLGGKCKINKRGYTLFTICNTATLKKLKTAVLTLNTPFLARKWDNINMDYCGRTELGLYRKNIVKDMLLNGKNVKNIAGFLGVPTTTIYQIIKRNNLKK